MRGSCFGFFVCVVGTTPRATLRFSTRFRISSANTLTSQRDEIIQPRVAAVRLPWVCCFRNRANPGLMNWFGRRPRVACLAQPWPEMIAIPLGLPDQNVQTRGTAGSLSYGLRLSAGCQISARLGVEFGLGICRGNSRAVARERDHICQDAFCFLHSNVNCQSF